MIDPTSPVFIVVFSLAVTPLLVFIAYVYMLKRFESSYAFCQRLRSLKRRIILSIIAGLQMTFLFYLIIFVIEWDDVMSVTTLSGVLVRMVTFAGLCTLGAYLGTTVASRMFGPTENARVPKN